MAYYNDLTRLRRILNELRTQCPWDRKQTLDTLRQLTIEETYELAGAITQKDMQGIKEELGDLLLHILFYARIGEEQNQFTLEDVIEGVCNKLVHRHPHIYGSVSAATDEEVKKNWEKLKLKEGKRSILSGVPQALPALVKALRLQEKTKTVGFEWEHMHQVREKVDEEIGELYEAADKGDRDATEAELGDVLFALTNYARFAGIDPEHALERTNQKFIRRFQAIEEKGLAMGRSLQEISLEEMDAIWNEVKQQERKPTEDK